MKRYEVVVTPEAELSIRESLQYLLADSPDEAARWLRRLYAKIDTLETFPERCGWAQERKYLEEDLRQMICIPYRIVFSVDRAANTVWVLHVRHASRRALGEPNSDEQDD